jgi:hypothetical protein
VARVLFLLLILANLVFLVWAQGYLGGSGENAGREPARLKEQLLADRLLVTIRDETAPQPPREDAPPAVGAVTGACRRIGPLAVADADKLKKVLTDKGGVVIAAPADETSYWVYIPSGGDKDAAEKKAQELKQMGVTDFFIVNDEGANHGAISLGLFHQEAAAKDLVQRLNKKGVRSAKIGTKVRKTEKILLEVRGSAELMESATVTGQSAKVAACPTE